jgi:hypothetical protein
VTMDPLFSFFVLGGIHCGIYKGLTTCQIYHS